MIAVQKSQVSLIRGKDQDQDLSKNNELYYNINIIKIYYNLNGR